MNKIKIKDLNELKQRELLIDLMFKKCYQRNEIVKISDLSSAQEVYDLMLYHNLPVRLDQFGNDMITLNFYDYIQYKNLYDEIYNNLDRRMTTIEFIEKYNISCKYSKLATLFERPNKIKDYNEVKDHQVYLNFVGIKNIIKIVDLMHKRRLFLSDVCKIYNLDFQKMQKILKSFTFLQHLKSIDDNEYNQYIKKFSKEIIEHPMYQYKLNELNEGKIGLEEFSHYFMLNEDICRDCLRSIMDEFEYLKLQSSRRHNRIKNTVIKKYGMEYAFSGNNSISNNKNIIIKHPNLSQVKLQKYIEDCYNTIMNNKNLLYIFNEQITNNKKETLKNLEPYILDNIELTYKLYLDKMGKVDIYPNGDLNQLFGSFIKVRTPYLNQLIRNKLVKPNYKHKIFKFTKHEYEFYLHFDDLFDANHLIINDRSILSNEKQTIECDFYLPSKKIGIEINPNYTHHSNKYRLNDHIREGRRSSSYHFNKYQAAKDNNVTLIQLFEYDLIEPQFSQITKPRIESLFNYNIIKIGAREVEINNITDNKNKVKNIRQFIELNHSLGVANGNYKYEIRYNDKIVGAALFKKLSNSKLELKRLCFKPDYKIMGCISKLIKRVFNDYNNINTIVTYSYNSYDTGQGYEKSGFKYLGETGPVLVFVNPRHPLDKYSWQITMNLNSDKSVINQDRIKKGLKPYYEEKFNIREYIETELSHRQDRQKGYDAIYTPGSKKWEIYRDDVIK